MTFVSRLRSRTGLIATLFALTAAGGGVLSSPAGASRHHTRRHHVTHHSCIPQHNGGDRDSDNRGGPSDGDGCL